MVLRFKNEEEQQIYFQLVDQLAEVLMLKGGKVLFEKEHYGEIMNKYVDICNNYMLWLAKDEDYGTFITDKPAQKPSEESDHITLGKLDPK